MLSKTFFAFLWTVNVALGQILTSCKTLQSSNDYSMTVAIDFNLTVPVVFFELEGPSDAWFGVGWDSTTMPDTYAMVVTSDDVVERTLGSNAGGSELDSSVTVCSDTTADGVRTIIFYRNAEADDSDYYDFSDVTSSTTIDIIWAVGSSTTFSAHTSSNRGSTSMW